MTHYRYIITDSQDIPLARGYLETPPDAAVWQVKVLDDAIDVVLEHEIIRLIGLDDSTPAMAGRILRHRGDILALEPVTALGVEVRQNLRVAIQFDSFIYPVSGSWKGRIPIVCHDLSCGGIAFFCTPELEPGEIVEVVIAITEPPLVLPTKVLRPRPSNSTTATLYAAKYLDLTPAEEAAVREAVFGRQIRNRRASQ